MQGLLEILQRLGPQRLVAMGAVTLALVGFFAVVVFRVSQPVMTTLFTDLSLSDANAIIRELDQRGVRYELRNQGGTILVPKENVLRLRMDLAGKGMPSGGGVGYEIFDKSDAFSTTSFVQNVNQLRALEGELARTIRSLDRVEAARVHLVMPERQLFQRERAEARASIVLRVRGELDAGGVRAVRHLVASAVPGLKPDRVSIVDEAGRLLADGVGDEASGLALAQAEKQAGAEARLRREIEEIVASVVGRGRARVQVTAEMDFNRIQQVQEAFDPEARVVRSTQTRTESSQSNEAREGQVTVANELPNAQGGGAQGNTREASNRNEETINYEISRTTRTETIEGGRLKRLSVAVLVDGVYGRENGQITYAPRPPEELERIAALVRSGVGFNQARGDQIEVVNLRFAEAPVLDAGREATLMERLLAFSKDDMLRMIELAVFGVLTLFVVLFVVRPLLASMNAAEKAKAMVAAVTGGAIGGATAGAIAGPGGMAGLPVPDPTPTEKMIEMSQFNGALQQRSIEKVGEVASKNPQETVAVLRQWLNEQPA